MSRSRLSAAVRALQSGGGARHEQAKPNAGHGQSASLPNQAIGHSLRAGDLPLGDAARVLNPGVDYWQTHTPDVGAMNPLELRDEAEQIKEKLFIQTQSSPQTVRWERVRDMLEQASAKLPQASEEAGGPKKRPRKGGTKASKAEPTPHGPRPPLTQRNASSRDPATLSRHYKDIVGDLSRKDLSADERSALRLELANIEPLVGQELSRRSALRYGELINQALTPQSRQGSQEASLAEHMRRIEDIEPDPERPGSHVLQHGRERIPMSATTLAAIRANAIRNMADIVSDVRESNEEVMRDYTHVVDQTFEKHPIVGAISMFRSEQNPLDWQDKLLPIVATSNIEAGEFGQMRKAARDPWNTAPVSLEAMARKVEASLRVGEAARTYLDYKTDQLHEGTRGAIEHLGRMKTAGQVAASIAFSPLGGALYSAAGSSLEQLSEMHYGQREHFDPWAPVIDAAAAYVGGKVTTGFAGGLGKNAPLWLRAAAFVPADRLGAAASSITHGAISRASGRSDKGLRDIMGQAGADLTDWKQAGINLFTVGLSHAARSRRGGRSGPPPSNAPTKPAAAKPPTAPPSPIQQGEPNPIAARAPAAATPAAASPSGRSTRVSDDPASFADASFDAIVRGIRDSGFGHRLEAGKRAGPAPLQEDTTRSRAQVDEVAHREARNDPPPGQVPGAQIQHDTKTLDVTRNLPAGMHPLHPDVINENLRWLQSRSALPATELLVSVGGGGTRYHVDTIPRGRAGDFGMPGHQPDLFPQARPPDRSYSTEHKFADAYLIPAQAAKIAQARRDAGLPPLDPRLLAISAGEMARWQTTGHSGTQRSGLNVDLAGAATLRPAPQAPPPAPSPQLTFPLFEALLRDRRQD